MPWDGELPHNWPGVAGLVVVGLVVIIAAQGVGGGLILRWQKKNNDAATKYRAAAAEDRETLKCDAAAIRDQVVNDHGDYKLRDNIDAIVRQFTGASERLEAKVDRVAVKQDRFDVTIDRLESKVDGIDQRVASERQNHRDLRNEVSNIRDRLPGRHHHDGGACDATG